MKRKNNNKICVRCKLEIDEKKERYMSISDFNKGKRTKEVFMHLKCWNDYGERKRNVNEAMEMMRGLRGALTKMGVFPKKEFKIA